MLSSTLRRSVATLGVAAGLLAAAGPASASDLPMEQVSMAVKAPTKAEVMIIDGNNLDRVFQIRGDAGPAGKTMAEDSWTGSARNLNDVEAIDLNALGGTQVGSEGVTADAGSGDDKVKGPTTATTGGFRGEVTGLEPH
jgi:hypothetical protein